MSDSQDITRSVRMFKMVIDVEVVITAIKQYVFEWECDREVPNHYSDDTEIAHIQSLISISVRKMLNDNGVVVTNGYLFKDILANDHQLPKYRRSVYNSYVDTIIGYFYPRLDSIDYHIFKYGDNVAVSISFRGNTLTLIMLWDKMVS